MYNKNIKYEILCEPMLGSDDKFVYIYKIELLSTNEYYYGVHSTKKLDDGYIGSGHLLAKKYQTHDISEFKKYILYFFENIDDAYLFEHNLVNNTMLQDILCLNLVPGGRRHESNKGKKAMHNFIKTIYVNENEIDFFLKLGWVTGRYLDMSGEKNPAYNKIWLNNGIVNKYVYKDDLEYYLNTGWIRGMLRYKKNIIKKHIWVNNGVEDKRILSDEIESFLKNNWTLGRLHYNRDNENYSKIAKQLRWINNGEINKKVLIDVLHEYLAQGWKPGRINITPYKKPIEEKRCWITKDKINKKVFLSVVETYLENGWTKGKYIKSYKKCQKK